MEAGDTIIAPAFLGLLKRACAIGRRRGELDDAQLEAHRVKLVGRLSRISALTPDSDAGRKMIKIINKTRRHLFVFITNRALSATNNGSERALRPCAVYRKITNGFRSEWAASLYADIRSVVETGRRRQVRAIDAIRLTLSVSPIPNPA
jgi:transposase